MIVRNKCRNVLFILNNYVKRSFLVRNKKNCVTYHYFLFIDYSYLTKIKHIKTFFNDMLYDYLKICTTNDMNSLLEYEFNPITQD